MRATPNPTVGGPEPNSPQPARVVGKSNPIKGTLFTIPGIPDHLKVYRVPASPFWWCRVTLGERRTQRSTRETEKKKAIKFARDFYFSLLRHDSSIPLKTSRSFERCALSLLEDHKQKAMTGERNRRFADDLRKQLNHRILKHFRSYPLKDIDYESINQFVKSMRVDGASASTIQRNLVSVRLVLKHAIERNLIDRLPLFPRVTVRDNPRPWFSPDEYELLKSTASRLAKEGIVIDEEPLTVEVLDFIIFMVNTFLRPSDWYNLRRRHIRVEKHGDEESILVISPPTSKTRNTEIVSMPTGVPVYERLVNRQNTIHVRDSNSFVFFPHIENRDRARNQMRVFFNRLLNAAGLKVAHTGEKRTIYSLRHTAISLRLLRGDNVDLLFLARNCRTSVAMIERFYASQLSALMAPEKVIGMKKKWRTSDKQKRKRSAKKMPLQEGT
jgi:Phage integrase SAM-like domain